MESAGKSSLSRWHLYREIKQTSRQAATGFAEKVLFSYEVAGLGWVKSGKGFHV